MDILRVPLNIIFKEQDPINIIKKTLYETMSKEYYFEKINRNEFINFYQILEKNNSLDEIDNIYEIVNSKMILSEFPNVKKSVFNILLNYSNSILDDLGNDIQCKYKSLLKWRMTSHKLDQDLFISSFLAYKDILMNRSRNSFNWDTTIKSNNIRLHNMLSKGMAENHFHLKGSAPTFNLSWISVMNDISTRKSSKRSINNRLEIDYGTSYLIEELIFIASILRVILFYSVQEDLVGTNELNNRIKFLTEILSYIVTVNGELNSNNISIYSKDVQKEINILKNAFGKKLKYKGSFIHVDYALEHDTNILDKSTYLFSGERRLLYNCFYKLFKGDKVFLQYADILYSYIIIKHKFRGELIQVNNRVGFSNFKEYQDRKTEYIKENTILKDKVEVLAVLTSIKRQNILSMETRLIPSFSANDNYNKIKKLDNIICNEIVDDSYNMWNKNFIKNSSENYNILNVERKLFNSDINNIKENYFYVYHFPKVEDSNLICDMYSSYRCRHYNHRKDLRKWCNAIIKMRESQPEIAKRVLAIDACSNELLARPEVYGQTFRCLKNHLPSEKKYLYDNYSVSKLKVTYHVGEDFLDVSDGLRAIDECINFLELSHGDRIGHAIALGIDVKRWYKEKNNKVYLSKQDILDNIAWIINKIINFNIEIDYNEIGKLRQIYHKYFLDIYSKDLKNIIKKQKTTDNSLETSIRTNIVPVETYIESWKLRGDNPQAYLNEKASCLRFWDRCDKKGMFDGCKSNPTDLVKELYMNYHYNDNVRKKGNEKECFKVEPYLIKIIEKIQKKMQIYVRIRGIGIECNPTSNYLISNFNKYDKHPILNMYNLGLTIDENEADKYPQMFVSINTDDQGVFSTLLENEFALMGIALEKAKDDEGNPLYNQAMIYDWLDRIRQMGLEQNFKISKTNNINY